MLEIPGFLSAEMFEYEDTENNKDCFVSHYRLKDNNAMETYFKEYSTKMRSGGNEIYFSTIRDLPKEN